MAIDVGHSLLNILLLEWPPGYIVWITFRLSYAARSRVTTLFERLERNDRLVRLGRQLALILP